MSNPKLYVLHCINLNPLINTVFQRCSRSSSSEAVQAIDSSSQRADGALESGQCGAIRPPRLTPLSSPPPSSNWLRPCCGRRVALWQVCLLSAGFNCILVGCVLLVVLFLALELLIDTKLLQCL